MSKLNQPENFAGRVNYAALAMLRGQRSTRALDNCFENADADAVCAALVRRARSNPALAAALPKYIGPHMLAEADSLAQKSPREIATAAAEMRRRRREEMDAWYARAQAERAEAAS